MSSKALKQTEGLDVRYLPPVASGSGANPKRQSKLPNPNHLEPPIIGQGLEATLQSLH